MRRTQRSALPGSSALLVLLLAVAFLWGMERWRRAAHTRAGVTEGARLATLARCLLGADGVSLLRTPALARQRLRALAVAAPADPTVTDYDRCVPLAAALARHASEVDDTNAPTGARSRVVDAARALQREMNRIGLVWRIRAGDPETDMDPVAEALAALATEMSLAGARFDERSAAPGEVVAPTVSRRPEGALVRSAHGAAAPTGLEPAPLGGPERFFVGAPLPALAEVRREGDGYVVDALANDPAFAWSVGPNGVLRTNARAEADDEGLALLRYFAPGADPVEALVTPVPTALEGIHVHADGVTVAGAFWFAQWTPWGGAALARVLPGRPLTALQLAPPPTAVVERAHSVEARRSTARDEHVAVAPLGAGVLAAFTLRDDAAGVAHVAVRAVLEAREGAAVRSLGEVSVRGRNPGLAACAVDVDAAVLLVAALHEWRALRVTAQGVSELARAALPAGGTAHEGAWLRCDAAGLVGYAREHAEQAPVLSCGPRGAGCAFLTLPRPVVPATLPLYTTRTPLGRALAHGSWPRALVRTVSGALVSVRGAGPLVSLQRRAASTGQWGDEAVLFDAAERVHGAVLEGLEVYSDARTGALAVAVATPEGLRVLRSRDEGARWE